MSGRGGKVSVYKGTLLDPTRFQAQNAGPKTGNGAHVGFVPFRSIINMEGNVVYPQIDLRSKLLQLKSNVKVDENVQQNLAINDTFKNSIYYSDRHPETAKTLYERNKQMKHEFTYIEKYTDKYRKRAFSGIERKYTPKTISSHYYIPRDIREMRLEKKTKNVAASERKLKRLLATSIKDDIEDSDDERTSVNKRTKKAVHDDGEATSDSEEDEDELIAESDAASDDYTMDHFDNGEDYEVDEDDGLEDNEGGSY